MPVNGAPIVALAMLPETRLADGRVAGRMYAFVDYLIDASTGGYIGGFRRFGSTLRVQKVRGGGWVWRCVDGLG